MTLPTPGRSTIRASSGGELHSAGIELLDVVHEVDARATSRAPASSVAKTPALPAVGTTSTCWNPASRASFAMYSGPCG
jgi:hypothetical protein